MYTVCLVAGRCSCVASLTRWASPPERVVAGWPRRMYPRPTSLMVDRMRKIERWLAKKSQASATFISRTSCMFLPRHSTSRVSRV